MPQDVPDIVRLAKALADGGFRYVVIGGMAMMLYGSNHVTLDCDLAVSSDPREADKLVEALRPLNPRPARGAGEGFQWDRFAIAGPFVRLLTDAGPVDLMRQIIGIDSFSGLYDRSNRFEVGDVTIRAASVEDLLAMKSVSPRDRDREHLRELEALRKLKGM